MKGMLNAGNLQRIVRVGFSKVKESSKRLRPIRLIDCLMSGYVVFDLKYPSLLQFDHDARDDDTKSNLKKVYKINKIPCDTQMRERLDEVEPVTMRRIFTSLFSQCQRSKRLELFQFYDNRYLMPLDGTGYFYSKEINCEECCQKNHRDGTIGFYHQILSGAIVHPDQKVVLPFAPEPIVKADGSTKNDCERNAAMRFLDDLKREHPHLKLITTGDGLFSNGPYIKRLKADDHRFILVAKEGDHKALFEDFRALPKATCDVQCNGKEHHFSWINQLSLNDSHPDLMVNVLEYWETNTKGKKQHWVWVTDILLSQDNVYQVMRGGRARHKIENETFNTLKNHGYHFEHNFGHGYKHLSTVFAYLMLTAFFVDQLQQLGCDSFKKALKRLKTKSRLWEAKRSLFGYFLFHSVDDLWSALARGVRSRVVIDTS